MTNDEWDSIALLLDKGWKGNFDDETAGVYRLLLNGYEPAQLLPALKRLLATGQPFLPAAAEIVAAIEEDVSWPTWSEAWSAIHKALSMGDQAYGLAFLEERHPLLVGFVKAEGYTRLSRERVEDPDHGPICLREIAKRFNAYSQRTRERVHAGLTIEQATSRELTRGNAMKQLNPALALDTAEQNTN